MSTFICRKCDQLGHIALFCNVSDAEGDDDHDTDNNDEDDYHQIVTYINNIDNDDADDDEDNNDVGNGEDDNNEDEDDNGLEIYQGKIGNFYTADDDEEEDDNDDHDANDDMNDEDNDHDICKSKIGNVYTADDDDDDEEEEEDDDDNHDANDDNERETRTSYLDPVSDQTSNYIDLDHIIRSFMTKLSSREYTASVHSTNDYEFSGETERATSQQDPNIYICKGLLTDQNVDVIVVSSSSNELIESVLQAAGTDIRKKYEEGRTSTSQMQTFSVNCSSLSCREILFVPWTPSENRVLVEQSIRVFLAKAIKYVLDRNYRSVAFPAIGCGQFGLNFDFIARTMINHIRIEQCSLNVTFAIHPNSPNVFDAFQNVNGSDLDIHAFPDSLYYADDHDDLCFPISRNTLEYDMIVAQFDTTMYGHYSRINRVERVQNERWHKQYLVHREDFKKRLNMNTEKFLYHGCPHAAADSIIKEYFNRSFAGKNGTLYGNGVYFSTRAKYSHSYAVSNNRGERCMFFARVLIGYSTLGDESMKVCPRDYHTTTDGEHVYVIYYDTQAYGQYLIYYQ